MRRLSIHIAAAVLVMTGAPRQADASYHFWGINEVFSDTSGNVQFVEMFTSSGAEQFLSGQSFTSTTKTLVYDHNFAISTANRHFLMATPGYAALPNVPAPDFIFPSNSFFSIAGDTLTLLFATGNIFGAGQPAQLTFTGAQLPTDGMQSLRFNLTANAVNSPTNFAGETGIVPEPMLSGAMLLGAGWVLATRPTAPRRAARASSPTRTSRE